MHEEKEKEFSHRSSQIQFFAVTPMRAGKTQLPKRLIVGKDRAAGKVFAGKTVIFAFCGFVGSEREIIAAGSWRNSRLRY